MRTIKTAYLCAVNFLQELSTDTFAEKFKQELVLKSYAHAKISNSILHKINFSFVWQGIVFKQYSEVLNIKINSIVKYCMLLIQIFN